MCMNAIKVKKKNKKNINVDPSLVRVYPKFFEIDRHLSHIHVSFQLKYKKGLFKMKYKGIYILSPL